MGYDFVHMAKYIRKRSIELAYASGNNAAHLGPALSLVEIFTALYGSVMNFNKENYKKNTRDRLILSKEHGVLSYYSVLEYIGVLSGEDLKSFMKSNSKFLGHPVMNREKGIEFTSGSLGMGLSLGVGVALALKKMQSNSTVYVILGDGECNEGSVWEAVMSASMLKLENLVVVIDCNGYQLGGKTEDTLDLGDLKEKFIAFNWDAVNCNGHKVEEIVRELNQRPKSKKPFALIANTVKGKGIAFTENSVEWHHSVLTNKLYREALEEIGENYE